MEGKLITDPLISDSALEAFKKFASVSCGQDNNIMNVVGLRIDPIEQSADIKAPGLREFESLDSDTPQEFSLPLAFQGATQKWLEQMSELFVSRNNHASPTWLEKFFFHKSRGPIDNLHARFNEILRCCEQIQAQDIKTLHEAIDKLKISPIELQRDIVDIINGVTGHSSKIFFLTASGHVGFSSASTRPGDYICLFPGGKYLQVLSSDCRRNINCASVKGLMGDSLLSRYQDWGSQCETFHLE